MHAESSTPEPSVPEPTLPEPSMAERYAEGDRIRR